MILEPVPVPFKELRRVRQMATNLASRDYTEALGKAARRSRTRSPLSEAVAREASSKEN